MKPTVTAFESGNGSFWINGQAQTSGVGVTGTWNAVTIFTSLDAGQGLEATSLTAASLKDDPSSGSKILMIAPSYNADFQSAPVRPFPLEYLARMFPARLAKSSG